MAHCKACDYLLSEEDELIDDELCPLCLSYSNEYRKDIDDEKTT